MRVRVRRATVVEETIGEALTRQFSEIAPWYAKRAKRDAMYPQGWKEGLRNTPDGLARWQRWMDRNFRDVKEP